MSPYLLPADDVESMVAHARREWPREACGLRLLHPQGQRVLYPVENVIAEMHRAEPSKWRPAIHGFVMKPENVRASMHWLQHGFVYDTLYHSHPTGQKDLSEPDRETLLKAAGAPIMRQTVWLVIGLRERREEPTLTAWAVEQGQIVERAVVQV